MAKVEPDANPEMQQGMAPPVQVNGRLPATGQLGHANPVKLLEAANPSPASSASPPDPQKPTAAHPAAAPFHCPLQAPSAAAAAAAAAVAVLSGQKEMPATPIKASTAGDVPMATPQVSWFLRLQLQSQRILARCLFFGCGLASCVPLLFTCVCWTIPCTGASRC